MLRSCITDGLSRSCLDPILDSALARSRAKLAAEHAQLVDSGDLARLKPSRSPFSQYSQELSETELVEAMAATDVAVLGLDDHSGLGYTYKCLAAGIACLRSGKSFVPAICDLVAQGGDADTNAAVAGALLGCFLGYKALAAETRALGWLDLTCVDTLLEPKVEALIARVLASEDVKAMLS